MKPLTDILSDAVNVGETERIISAGVGAGLVAMALHDIKNPSIATWAELVTGGLLMFRGASGYCPVNSAIGRNTAKNAEKTFEKLAE